jgi:predicted TIM-barrel fold metal-dependent hydrolase
VAEFERCLEKGFHGGSVTTGRESDSLASRDLEPVFDVAERCDAPIFVHVPPRRQSEFKMDVVLSREHSLAESIYEAINAGVFDRHPELNLVYHHFGGNIAGMMGHIDLHLDEGRWPGQDDLKSPAAFRTQLCENVSVDTAGFFGYPGPLRSALEEFPAENVLFGSDYPWELRDPGELSGAVETVVASTNHVDARKILGENALNVLCNVD